MKLTNRIEYEFNDIDMNEISRSSINQIQNFKKYILKTCSVE